MLRLNSFDQKYDYQPLPASHKTFGVKCLFVHPDTHQILVSVDRDAARSPKRFIPAERYSIDNHLSRHKMKRYLLILAIAIFKSNLYSQDTNSLMQKVLFLTNSTFHASGGAMKPFNGYCGSAGSNFEALGSYGFFRST